MADRYEVPGFDPVKLKQVRGAGGFTQAELARHLGVSRQAVYQWETGRTSPTREAFRAMCRLLGCAEQGLLR